MSYSLSRRSSAHLVAPYTQLVCRLLLNKKRKADPYRIMAPDHVSSANIETCHKSLTQVPGLHVYFLTRYKYLHALHVEGNDALV